MKNLSKFKFWLILFSVLVLQSFLSCVPVFSEIQSAKTLGKNNVDLTADISSVGQRDIGRRQSDYIQNHYGFQGGYGLTDKVDLRIRYSYLWSRDRDEELRIFNFGPKVSLVKDRIALYMPVGFGYAGDHIETRETWHIHPTVLGTISLGSRYEINPSIKLLIPFSNDYNPMFANNLGLGISISKQFILRPEFGMLFIPKEDFYYRHYSVGVTYNLN